jgi:hypothetical protein
MKSLLRGTSQVLFVLAGLSFFGGGLAIKLFTNIDRVSAEMIGIGVAVVCGILGVVASRAGDYLVDSKESGSSK